ncbi:hypothetical protein BDV25DRAFT_147694 [Aspergillus avenaceus]|uniref:GDSL lipase/esterase n=1 Tax=Aspergillus avenaceus TaxID=36643 RepID=A0A5N6U778_ASPAV|nr:hypothetical protein BDV25DRAFT_147694 [Aspergillus avenaceus]
MRPRVALAASALAGMTCGASLKSRVSSHWPGFDGLKTLFVFGDSYSRTGFDPTAEEQPSSSNPLGNPEYPGRTSANGPNWVDLLTVKHNASQLLTYNFGASGATLDTSIVDNGMDVIREIEELFLPNYGDNGTFEADSSLFAIWIGINDITNSYLTQNDSIHPAIFDSYRYRVDQLYDAGVRNFLLLNVPPLERAPRTTQSSASETRIPIERNATADWNSRTKTLQTRIQYLHSDATVFLYDAYTLFDEVIDNPSKYEQTSVYKNTTSHCEAYKNGTPEIDTKWDNCTYAADEYLWINNLHPTSPIHDLLAEQVAALLASS